HLETELAESTVERLFSVGQKFTETGWPYELLDFDRLTPDHVRRMYDQGRSFARRELDSLQFTRPPAVTIEPYLDDLIHVACQVFGSDDNSTLKLRANIFVPEDLDLVLEYRTNMDGADDSDRGLRLEYWQGLVGFSFSRRRPVVCNLQRLGQS